MKTEKTERIIERIRKIYELTTSDNEGERQAAKAKLDELCAKYKLSIEDIVSERTERHYVKPPIV